MAQRNVSAVLIFGYSASIIQLLIRKAFVFSPDAEFEEGILFNTNFS